MWPGLGRDGWPGCGVTGGPAEGVPGGQAWGVTGGQAVEANINLPSLLRNYEEASR